MSWMSYLKQVTREFLFRSESEQQLDEELQFHLEMQERENRKKGMSDEEAYRLAAIQLGGLHQTKEKVRSQRPAFWLETMLKDVSYAARVLRKTFVLTAISILTLALAIGACTFLFSIFDSVLLQPLPYDTSERLVAVYETNPSKGVAQSGVNGRNLLDWRDRSNVFEGIAAYYTMGRTLSRGSDSEVVLTSQVTADFFRIFKTQPLHGRTFTEQETEATRYNNALGAETADPLVVLSNAIWTRHFGSDPAIVGRTITLDRTQWKVIGVMPPKFAMPNHETQLWIPWGIRHDYARDQHFAGAVARLRDGVTIDQAESRLSSIVQQLAKEHPATNTDWIVRIIPLQEFIVGDVREIIRVLVVAVSLVLLIACANIAILQLSRATARLQESSVRLALGATRTRLVRQFFVESALLAIIGGVLGVAVAYFSLESLQHVANDFPRIHEVVIDRNVLLVSLTVTAVSGLLFGLAPAFLATRGSNQSSLRIESTRMTARCSAHRLRNALVVMEIAFATILLCSSAMLIRSFSQLRAVKSGYQTQNVLVMPIFLDMERYGSGEKSRGYYSRLLEGLQNVPGVLSVGGATALPGSPLGPNFERPVWKQRDLGVNENKHHADVRIVTPDYFRALGIQLIKGRAFHSDDRPDSPGVIIINEKLAARLWPDGNAIGQQLVVDYSSSGTYPYLVVGVVNDIRFNGPRSEPKPEIYFPHAQRSYLILNIAVKTAGDPRFYINSVREVLRTIDPQKPAHSMTPLEDLIGATMKRDRYAVVLFSCFAGAALLLALMGIYGVVTFFVRRKTQEIGIRIALGATQDQIARWIGAQGAWLMFTGLIIGLTAALIFVRLLSTILFQVSPFDARSFVSSALILFATAVAACWVPVRRATKLSPTQALRYE